MPSSRSQTPEELLGPLNEVEKRNAPAELFLAGDPELLRRGRRVAIVGSRRASELGVKRAIRLAHFLASRNVIVVSGLAEGIDTAAHGAAIKACGRTVAVLGTPLDESYPRSNEALQLEIAKHNALVSQFAAGTPVQRKNFVLRNRTMALISNASVIVEAGEGSGTLSQGWEALRLGRPLFLMKSVVEREDLEWPSEMLDYGARVLSSPEELLAFLPFEPLREPQDAPF